MQQAGIARGTRTRHRLITVRSRARARAHTLLNEIRDRSRARDSRPTRVREFPENRRAGPRASRWHDVTSVCPSGVSPPPSAPSSSGVACDRVSTRGRPREKNLYAPRTGITGRNWHLSQETPVVCGRRRAAGRHASPLSEIGSDLSFPLPSPLHSSSRHCRSVARITANK